MKKAVAFFKGTRGGVTGGAHGMHGSGMFLINPPYTLPAELKTVLPSLQTLCGEDSGSRFVLEARIP